MERDNPFQTFERREFLKKAGLAGLALAGLGAGLGSLGGCMVITGVRPVGRGESIYPPKNREEIMNKDRLELEDFLLTKEEMKGMRYARGWEGANTTKKGEMNPLKESSSLRSIGGFSKKVPLCEEWIIADYVKLNESSLIELSNYNFIIAANRFKSETDMKEVREFIKVLLEKQRIKGDGEVLEVLFSRDCLLSYTSTAKKDVTKSEEIYKEYQNRIKEYAKIRKLEVF